MPSAGAHPENQQLFCWCHQHPHLLNREINSSLADPKMKTRLADVGGTILPGSPADFHKLIATDTEKWAKVVKFARLKPD